MKEDGFSLIEIVVVIVILGVLAATALPRFIDISDEAHRAKVAEVFNAFSAGVELTRSKLFIDNQQGSTGVAVGSLTLDVNNAGLPINFGSGASAVANCTTFINEVANISDPFNPFAGPVSQPANGWQVLANSSLCLYLYKTQPQPLRYFIYNPTRINFGGGLGNNVFILLSP